MEKQWTLINVYSVLLLFYITFGAKAKICGRQERVQSKNNTSMVRGKEICCPGYKWSRSGCEECEDGFYGYSCMGRCNCPSDHSRSLACNKVTGRCKCRPGWQGKHCFRKCNAFSYGRNCKKKCRCLKQHTKKCHHATGRCICEASWEGRSCSRRAVVRGERAVVPTTCLPGFGSPGCIKCPAFFYLDCKTPCKCVKENSQSCDNVFGNCTCKDGYIGDTCNTKCDAFYYGTNCKSICPCDKSRASSCDHVTGKCVCLPGYDPDKVVAGKQCTQSCSGFTYGQNCSSNCSCITEYAENCNSRYGNCLCKPGRIGEKCEKECSGWSYGYSCDSACDCIVNNTQKCNPVNGACDCKAGYTGKICTEKCTSWKYGANCNSNCSCVISNTYSCDGVDGSCNCSSGWQGATCSEVCTGFKFGPQCATPCNCPTNAYLTCHHLTGKCTCKPGFYGTSCENECVEGTYGANCLGVCNCTAATTLHCDKAIGTCVCKSGYTGTTCSEVIVDVAPGDLSLLVVELQFALVAIGTFLAFALIVFIIWHCLKCTCKEFKQRLCNKNDEDKDHEILTNDKNASTLEMNTVSNKDTLQKDGRSPSFAAPEYYYSSDLNVIEGKDNAQPSSQKAEPSQDYYYSESLTVPDGKPVAPGTTPVAATKAADPGVAYYADGFTPKLPGVDSIPRGKPQATSNVQNKGGAGTPKLPNVDTIPRAKTPELPGVSTIPRGKGKNEETNPATGPAYYTDAFTPKLPGVETIPNKKPAMPSQPSSSTVNSIPGYAKVDKPPQQMYQNFGTSGNSQNVNLGQDARKVLPTVPVPKANPVQHEYGNIDEKPRPKLEEAVYESLDVDPNRQTLYTELPE